MRISTVRLEHLKPGEAFIMPPSVFSDEISSHIYVKTEEDFAPCETARARTLVVKLGGKGRFSLFSDKEVIKVKL